MFQRLKAATPDPEALERAEALVRARFRLAERDLVMVREEARRRPSGSLPMVSVLFWCGETRHRLAIFKPVAELTEADLPPAWLRGALRDEGEVDCC